MVQNNTVMKSHCICRNLFMFHSDRKWSLRMVDDKEGTCNRRRLRQDAGAGQPQWRANPKHNPGIRSKQWQTVISKRKPNHRLKKTEDKGVNTRVTATWQSNGLAAKVKTNKNKTKQGKNQKKTLNCERPSNMPDLAILI